ncbi:peptidase T [Parapedobacter indicus]|uniref:Peptidase T n=1 Tax=Parapedobacter indicus TaxID=1477437 RepID=A0A1I3N8H5_9SPHI|nr:peptidase T [Parapedobacter indicus]PPL00906.1 tripeptide aminopeptidase [Parapedobacter indicus]SFJ05340.1 peptidase T. Metallo peptidase. MEROPS family M20B [Parapedobacter indicus]
MSDLIINTLTNSGVEERFLRYVQVDTQSDPSSSTYPSTEKQKNLGRILVDELLALGIDDAHLDEYGYVYATIPANSNTPVPVICFCSHMDTSPDCSGTGVKPVVHRNYQGGDITLPDDSSVVIKPSEHPDLRNQVGNDLITASGTTLLGADDKAGVAEIMTAAQLLMTYPEIKHGTLKILFTPDEEIGRGVDKVDLTKLGADFAYTLDGETAGSIEDETFSADGVTVLINGVSVHPGFAKGKLQSAIKIASEIIHTLPKDRLSPESTNSREGFVHPVSINGGVEQATLEFIVRDFVDNQLETHERELENIVKTVVAKYPGCSYRFSVKEQYRNMKQVLDKHLQIMEIGLEAIRRAGMQPLRRSIRGGTDGSRLSFMGLPCPNVFAGGHAFHGRQEWVSVQDMEKAVRTILHIAALWEEHA